MNNLKLLRKNHRVSQEILAKMLNVKQNTISNWENGRTQIDQESILKLADYFDVTVDYLLGREASETPSAANIYSAGELLVFEEIGTVCAGYGGSVNEIPTGRQIEIPASMLGSGKPEDYFVLRVKGNSMYPRLLEGDTILCRRCDSVDSGSLAVILYDGEDATVKKVNYVQGQDWLELIPINPEYQTKRIEGPDLEQCRILGLVVKLIRDL